MVIDEIGRPAEVEAAQTCKQRGVRIVASAHGDLRKLLENKQLNKLIGGKESVVVGDKGADTVTDAAGVRRKQKVQTQRQAAPIFDVIVELERGRVDECSVVKDAAAAVDAIIAKQTYRSERRVRDASTGALFVEPVDA